MAKRPDEHKRKRSDAPRATARKTKTQPQAKTKARRKPTKAERADRYALYQTAVQSPDADVEFFTRIFTEKRGRKPLHLREDFCGTAHLSSTWVASDRARTAIGVDIDGEPLAWGREHNLARLNDSALSRLTLHQADVLDGVGGRTEITCAMNFSYCVFKRRASLRRYFENVYALLAEDGLFFTEIYGGTEAVIELEEERECKGFTYVWEQEFYNPIDHHTQCHIHFAFSDGSRIDRAFTYDWRLWTVPELRDLLEEVGFREVTVYWETTDEDGEGTGEYEPTEREDNQESWLVYIVASK